MLISCHTLCFDENDSKPFCYTSLKHIGCLLSITRITCFYLLPQDINILNWLEGSITTESICLHFTVEYCYWLHLFRVRLLKPSQHCLFLSFISGNGRPKWILLPFLGFYWCLWWTNYVRNTCGARTSYITVKTLDVWESVTQTWKKRKKQQKRTSYFLLVLWQMGTHIFYFNISHHFDCLYMWMCVCVSSSGYLQVSKFTHRCQRLLIPLELGSQVVVCCLPWVLEMELVSFARPVWTLTYRTISLATWTQFFLNSNSNE